MNLLILLGIGTGSIAVLWGAQTVLLLAFGRPLAGPLRAREPPTLMRWMMKGVLQLVLLGLLIAYPLAIGERPLGYHLARLQPVELGLFFEAFLLNAAFFVIGTFAEVGAGWVSLEARYGPMKTFRKVAQSFLTPLPLTLMEEGIFRGVVLEALLSALPSATSGQALAVILSAVIFSLVHFLRPAKTYAPAGGLFVLGCLLGTAYLLGGRSYWLPLGIHAGGVLAIQILRPFVVYRGPPWIIGYRSYPIAGAIGIGSMALIGGYLFLRLGENAGGMLRVGQGMEHARIEDAVARARPGDTIEVHPLPGNRPYEKVAVQVSTKGLTIRAARNEKGPRIPLSGEGSDVSGRGPAPRAVIQFNPAGDGCVIEGFEISGARNQSHNGAAVRILGASHVAIRDCELHHNDMGIMSSGDGTAGSALDQRIEHCVIRHNGCADEPGQSHNLYLGGGSATLSFCEVHHSTVGHNVKSRAHHTRVEYCYLHDSANRELDLVDAAETARPQSDGVLVGNIIVKARDMTGNKTVIHFGQDGGKDHQGTLFLIHNTIISPYLSAVIDLSAPGARAHLAGNLIWDGGSGQRNQKLIAARNGALPSAVTASRNWVSAGFTDWEGPPPEASAIAAGRRDQAPSFADAAGHDYRPAASATPLGPSPLGKGPPGEGPPQEELRVPPVPGSTIDRGLLEWQYRHPAGKEKRPRRDPARLGACDTD